MYVYVVIKSHTPINFKVRYKSKKTIHGRLYLYYCIVEYNFSLDISSNDKQIAVLTDRIFFIFTEKLCHVHTRF